MRMLPTRSLARRCSTRCEIDLHLHWIVKRMNLRLMIFFPRVRRMAIFSSAYIFSCFSPSLNTIFSSFSLDRWSSIQLGVCEVAETLCFMKTRSISSKLLPATHKTCQYPEYPIWKGEIALYLLVSGHMK